MQVGGAVSHLRDPIILEQTRRAQLYWLGMVATKEQKEKKMQYKEKYKALKKWCLPSRADSKIQEQHANRHKQTSIHMYF